MDRKILIRGKTMQARDEGKLVSDRAKGYFEKGFN